MGKSLTVWGFEALISLSDFIQMKQVLLEGFKGELNLIFILRLDPYECVETRVEAG